MSDQTRRTARLGKTFTGKGKTDQTAVQNQQVGRILAEYRANGTMPRVNPQTPLYGDFTSARDLQSQMESYQAASHSFAVLPAEVRAAANNDMIQYVTMIEDPSSDDGRQALADAGLEIEGFDPLPSLPPEPSPTATTGPPSEAETPPETPV